MQGKWTDTNGGHGTGVGEMWQRAAGKQHKNHSKIINSIRIEAGTDHERQAGLRADGRNRASATNNRYLNISKLADPMSRKRSNKRQK